MDLRKYRATENRVTNKRDKDFIPFIDELERTIDAKPEILKIKRKWKDTPIWFER
jgi:hypothetical protein